MYFRCLDLDVFFFLSDPSPCFKKQKYSFSFYNMLIKLNW